MTGDAVVLVNEFGQDAGSMAKVEAHRLGAPHRAVSAFVFNPKGQLLVQRRTTNKEHSGGLWSNTCCTHPYRGETPHDAAVRRLEEELGVDAEISEVFRFWYTARVPPNLIENEYDHVFIGVSESIPNPDPSEVSDYAWWDVRNLRE